MSTWQADAYIVAMRPEKQTNILTQVRSKRIMSPGQDRNACMASVGYICPDVRTISTKFRFTTAQRTKWHQVFAKIVHKHVYSLGCPFRSTHSNGGKGQKRAPVNPAPPLPPNLPSTFLHPECCPTTTVRWLASNPPLVISSCRFHPATLYRIGP